MRGPDLRSSPWGRRLRFPSCPFVSFVDILKAGKRKPHRPPFTPRAAGSARSRFAVISLGSPSPLSFVPLCVLRGYPQSWQKEAASPPFTPRAGGGARSRFAVISLGSQSPLSFVPLCVLRGYPQSWQKEAASPPFHTPRRRQCPDQICGHLPGIAVSAFLRAPLCPSWISSKLAKGSRIAPPLTPRVGGGARSRFVVISLGSPSPLSFVPLCVLRGYPQSWQKEAASPPFHTPRRRQCPVQICGHLPGVAVSAFLRAPLCPSWISLKLAKGSRIAPLHTSPPFRAAPHPVLSRSIASELGQSTAMLPCPLPYPVQTL